MKASEKCSRLYVSQPRQLKGLSASVLVLDRKFLEGRECVHSTMACAINVCLKRKDQTSGTTEMSDNHLNYMDKATNPQKTRILRHTTCLLPSPLSKRQGINAAGWQ